MYSGFRLRIGPERENQRSVKGRPNQRNKKAVEHDGEGDIDCSWYTWNRPKALERGQVKMEIKSWIDTNQSAYNIIEKFIGTWINK